MSTRHHPSQWFLAIVPLIAPLANVHDAAGEIEPAEVLGAGDGVSEDGPVRRHKLHDVGREPGFQQDLVDGVVGEHGGVAGLPQDHVSLRERRKSAREKRLKPARGCARLKCSGKSLARSPRWMGPEQQHLRVIHTCLVPQHWF